MKNIDRFPLQRVLLLTGVLAVAAACSESEQKSTATPREAKAAPSRVAVPVGAPLSKDELRQQRFDERWKQLASFKGIASPPLVESETFPETIEDIRGITAASAAIHVPFSGEAAGPSVLRVQILLDRLNYSVGAIDGAWGKNSEIATYWFQKEHDLAATGIVDQATYVRLRDTAELPLIIPHQLTADDVAGPFVRLPESVYDQAKLDCLCYESLPEKLAERFHTTPDLLSRLNPQVNLNALRAGHELVVPNVRGSGETAQPSVSRIVVSVEGTYLHAFDASGKLVMHAPTSVGSEYDPSPSETLKVVATAYDPTFYYQPTLFAEVPDENPEANLQPGPNSPVGVVWMALSKDHYGIHGTSDPESIGYASSHGCIRLTNWSAQHLAKRVPPGTKVEFVDAR